MNGRLPLVLILSAGLLLFAPRTSVRAQATGTARELMPSFSVPGARGDSLRLSAFRGRLLVINLWTSWCIPCKQELPALDSLAGTLDTASVAVLALTDDVTRSAAEHFLAEHPVRHVLVGFGGGDLKHVLHAFGVPETWVVDTAGRVARFWPGFAGASQVQAIRDLLAAELGHAPEHSR
jgi:peroxiredoxin